MIHFFARFHPTPSRRIATRMVSLLTFPSVNPRSWATAASNSSVHVLRGLPNTRGLWCRTSFSRSRLASPSSGTTVLGRLDRRPRAPVPPAPNARITFRTVCRLQPTAAAIPFTRSPRLLASRIWLRRSTNPSRLFSPDSNSRSSTGLNARTNIGWCMHLLRHRPIPRTTGSLGLH